MMKSHIMTSTLFEGRCWMMKSPVRGEVLDDESPTS